MKVRMIDACRTVSWLMLVLAFLLVASSSPVKAQYSMTVESSAAVGTEEDGSCEYCSCYEDPQAGYGILVEVHAEHTEGILAGLTTYRMYITTPNDNDVISAVYGDDETPLEIATTTSFYQHEFGSALGSNNNPLLYTGFPELEFDSWLTIGLDAPPGANELAPSTIGDLNNGWISNFEAGLNVLIQDSIGGAMFVTNDPGVTNIVSGVDQRILIGQFTTDGELSGIVNAQMFTQGIVDPADRVSMPFSGLGLSEGGGDVVCGCTDVAACNYDPDANNDDGSCEYDSCTGCTDSEACNYDDSASVDDGSCEYPEFPCVACDGTCLVDEDEDGVCDCQEFPGCTDPEACNYDPIYTDDAGNCYYAEEFYDCAGNCLCDEDGDGVCCELEVFGCTDPEFCDYNPDATEDDGSCWQADQINDVCSGAIALACGETVLGNNEECASVDDTPGCAETQPNNPTAGLWYSFVGTGGEVVVSTCYPGTSMDTYLSIYEGGCDNLNCVAGNDDQSEPFYDDLCPFYTFASTVVMETVEGAEYHVLVMGVFDEAGDFEVGVSCVLEGCTDADACNFDSLANVDDGSCTFPEEFLDCEGNCLCDEDGDGVCCELEVLGCTDEMASNYNDLATEEDGSCQYCDLEIDVEVIQQVACLGDSNAVAQLTLTGVVLSDSVSIYLNDVLQDTTTFVGLGAGDYTVEVFEGADCSALMNFTVEEGTALELSVQISDVLCYGDSTGAFSATVSNAQGIVEFVLDGPVTASNASGEFGDLPSGDYLLLATDSVGCEGVIEFQILEPEALALDAVVTDATEEGLGAIDLTVQGGTDPYEFAWSGDGGFEASTEDVDGLEAPASYSVLVTDANGCELAGGPYEVDDVYGLQVIQDLGFEVFPNPANGLISLRFPDAIEEANITIYDASGRLIWTRSNARWSGLFLLDMSPWANGTYHIQLSSSNGMGHAPLVVQH